jgi:tellurite resistance protein TerC
VYVVFTATAFSLMGLRQLYFLLDGLLDRLIYLSYGLAAILGFIGIKLILHALHENNLPFINNGEHVDVIEITTGLSLTVIIGVLVITVVASLVSKAGKAQTAINNARRHAEAYLDLGYTADLGERERIYTRLVEEERNILTMEQKYREKAKDIDAIREKVSRAHARHEEITAGQA